MTSLRLRASMALAFAAFTAACGGGDGSSGPSFPDSVSTADAQDFADGVADYASQVAYGINFNGPSVGLASPTMVKRIGGLVAMPTTTLPGVTFQAPTASQLDWRQVVARVKGPQLVAGAGCTVTMHGSDDPFDIAPTDANGNGLPDDFYLKIVCVETDSVATDTVVTQTTTEEIALKEIAGSLYGMTVKEFIQQEAHDNHGRYQFIKYDITAKQDIRTDGIVDQAAFTARQETNISGDVEFEEAGESWNNSFDPASAISPESNIPDGDLRINGRRYYANSDDQNLSFSISTTDPLAYSATCAAVPTTPPFTDGTLLGKLNNSSSQASFQVDFTSCGNFDVTVNGAYDEVAVANHP